jgi:hypothetical protein
MNGYLIVAVVQMAMREKTSRRALISHRLAVMGVVHLFAVLLAGNS